MVLLLTTTLLSKSSVARIVIKYFNRITDYEKDEGHTLRKDASHFLQPFHNTKLASQAKRPRYWGSIDFTPDSKQFETIHNERNQSLRQEKL